MNKATELDHDAPSAEPTQPGGKRWGAHFIVAVVVMSVAAIGLNAATQMFQLHFKKVAIPLKADLNDPQDGLAARIGPWQMVSLDAPLPHDLEENLGTKQYVFRDYVDTRKVTEAELAAFQDKSAMQRRYLLDQLQRLRPEAVINIAVTYYTGLVDTVPHVPDVCYVADGYRPVNPSDQLWDVPSPYLNGAKLPVRFIDFEDQSGKRLFRRNVAYFFQTQGNYESHPMRVRFHMQNLSQRETYFAKVEVMTTMDDRDASIELMKDFLTVALPEVERRLPNYPELMKQGQQQTAAINGVSANVEVAHAQASSN
ncbi:MAG TPA: hypothetical protein VGN72_00690 [Tepidisphaeraceae bacterium]|jgi:hypothetical protein|nr:hypothetical protein [Tepidisphaeraceae bacterium]